MGKINKHANLYSRTGEKIRSVNENNILTDVTIEELEEMIDNYPKDGDKIALDNLKMYLFSMYNKYGNPHEAELIERIKAQAQIKSSSEEVSKKLNEVAEGIYGDSDVDGDTDVEKETIMDEYVDFEEVKEAA